MRYVRPFTLDGIKPGDFGPWLLAPEEGAGLTARLRRGGGSAEPVSQPVERIAIVLSGSVEARPNGLTASAGGVIFLPPASPAAIAGLSEAVWLEIEADPIAASAEVAPRPLAITVDENKFLGTLFAHQSILDRTKGSRAVRLNAMRVQPGAGSPDFHIHAFSQMYVIQEGEMTVDVGRHRYSAPAYSFVYLPAGVVHRNFNASGKIERHISVLIPEPRPGDIFDYAVEIHEREAELITSLPVTEPVGA